MPFSINEIISFFFFGGSNRNNRIHYFIAINNFKRRSDNSSNRSLISRHSYQYSDILDISLDVTQCTIEGIDPQTDLLGIDLLVDDRLGGQYIGVELSVVVLYFSFELRGFLSDDSYVRKMQFYSVYYHLLHHEICLDTSQFTSVTKSPGPFSQDLQLWCVQVQLMILQASTDSWVDTEINFRRFKVIIINLQGLIMAQNDAILNVLPNFAFFLCIVQLLYCIYCHILLLYMFGSYYRLFIHFCLQKFIKQKMESNNSQMLNQAKETASICSQLNLDINRLENSTLMDNPIYTRLYNIVKNDMSRKDMAFRKNLIKQIYFLLQVTPVIRSELQEQFLEQVQKVYNLHDHKKIDLASNKLYNLLSIVHSKKESTYSNFERPKSGVTWNKNVPSFLRPYTASRKTPKNNTVRPDSSKFNQSTKVSWEDVEIRQFTTNIEEQLEISKDFIQRHRTLHPEYEPVYEQLYNILKTIEPKRVEEPSLSITAHKSIKYPRSAVTRTKEQSWVYPEKNRQSEHLNTSEAQEEQIYNSNQVHQQKEGEQSSEEEEYIYQNQKKKPYKPYSEQVKPEVETVETKNRENCMKKYSHIVNTKLVQAAREDQQMAEKYVHYARVKSALRRQMNRRNESKRLMSAKPFSQSTLKYTKLVQTSNKQNEEKDSHTIDLTKDPLALPSERINAHPTYNRRQFLKNKYEYPLNQFKKINNIGYIHSSESKIQNAKRPMTAYTRFHSPQKFDPLNPDNVKQYNNDVLEELQKIKSKLGGKCYASTESLMKALAVPEPHLPDDLTWESKNPFYNMVSMGRKKLKKKSRKGVKLQKKGLSVRR